MGDDAGKKKGRRLAERAKALDNHPLLLDVARRVRRRLPGDSEFGDPLSTAGSQQTHIAARRLSELTETRPGVLRETGFTALQLWQAFSEAQGRGRSEEDMTIVFTDLAGFSDWALEAGDEQAVALLRQVDCEMDPAVRRNGGRVVKRLGDGIMAVFDSPADALRALVAARDGLESVETAGYRPRFRAGMHVGRPRRLGGDLFGVDVNIAARVAETAEPDEILVSDRALRQLDGDGLDVRRKRRFKVKGVPKDLEAYSVCPKA